MNSTISVIIPTYNRARYISEALRSVLSQSVKPLEIIVVDDGSTDNTREVVGALQEANPHDCIRYIYQANAGASAARNRGIAEARGTHIAFLDSDDRFASEHVLAQHLALLKTHPGLAVTFGREAKFSDGYGPRDVDDGHRHPTGPMRDALESLVRCLNVPTSSVLVRRDALKNVGEMDRSLKICQDLDLWFRLAKYGFRFGFIDCVLAHRRMHPGNLVNESRRTKEEAVVVFERHAGRHPEARKHISQLRYDLGSAYLKRREWAKAEDHLARVDGRLGWRLPVFAAKWVIALAMSTFARPNPSETYHHELTVKPCGAGREEA